MTEEQLKTFRAECRALAFESAAALLYQAVAEYRPDVLPILLQSAKKAQENYDQMAVPGIPAEYSDLAAAEYRDAHEKMIQALFGERS